MYEIMLQYILRFVNTFLVLPKNFFGSFQINTDDPGAFDVPDRESIPELEVYISTQKGVALSYSQT